MMTMRAVRMKNDFVEGEQPSLFTLTVTLASVLHAMWQWALTSMRSDLVLPPCEKSTGSNVTWHRRGRSHPMQEKVTMGAQTSE